MKESFIIFGREEEMYTLLAIILILFCTGAILTIPFGLPGTFIIVGVSLIFKLIFSGEAFSWSVWLYPLSGIAHRRIYGSFCRCALSGIREKPGCGSRVKGRNRRVPGSCRRQIDKNYWRHCHGDFPDR